VRGFYGALQKKEHFDWILAHFSERIFASKRICRGVFGGPLTRDGYVSDRVIDWPKSTAVSAENEHLFHALTGSHLINAKVLIFEKSGNGHCKKSPL
jgi:hypothetical protein